MFTQADAGAPADPAPAWRPGRIALPGGTSLAVFEIGRTESSAPTLVLLHGMGHWTQAAWNALVPFFVATHRIVACDLPGFGISDKPDVRYTLTYFTSVLGTLMERLELADVVLVGHSYGGLIAANYAAGAPTRRPRALVLLDPAGFLRTPKLVLRVLGSAPMTRLITALRPTDGFVQRTLDQSVFDKSAIGTTVRARALELAREPAVRRAFARTYAGAMHELAHMRALHRRLAAWTGPTLVAWGNDDRYIPARGLALAAAVYPHATLLPIARCGHCPAIEHPAHLAPHITTLTR